MRLVLAAPGIETGRHAKQKLIMDSADVLPAISQPFADGRRPFVQIAAHRLTVLFL